MPATPIPRTRPPEVDVADVADVADVVDVAEHEETVRLRAVAFETARSVLALQRRTERERADATQALREAEETARLTFEHAPVGIGLVSLEGRWLRVNTRLAAMLGRSEGDLVGAPVEDALRAADDESARAVASLLAHEDHDASEGDARCLRQGGGTVQLVLRASVVHGPDGRPRSRVLHVEDVTESRRIEAQLVHADRMVSVGTLASGIAHEINNPLTYIGANVGLVRDELAEVSGLLPEVRTDLLEMLASALDGAERIRRIVLGLRTFGREQPEPVGPIDLRRVLESALLLTANHLRHRARVDVDIPEHLPAVFADDTRLVQVFVNLLVNAGDALDESRARENVVAVRVRAAEGSVTAEVTDNGCGIAPNDLAQIFDPFFTTKPVGRGTGLGLSISHGIVASLGGTIAVDSVVGRGTSFVVTLSVAGGRFAATETRAASAARAASVRPEEKRAAGAPETRVLVVDDDPDVVDVLRRVLGREHQLTCVRDGTLALALVRGGARFDAILCDMMMPDRTGAQVLAELSDLAPEQANRVAFVTGGAFTEATEAGLAGEIPVLGKPFEASEVRRLVKDLAMKGGR